MIPSRCLILLLGTSVTYAALPLPSYMKPCARNDPKLNDCVLEHGKAAIPHLIKGDRKYGIPNLDPLEVTEIQAPSGTLTLHLKNVKFNGLKDVDLKKTEFDLKNNEYRYEMFFPVIELLGNYEIGGRILLLPITGNGEINVTINNANIKANLQTKIVEMDGKKYLDFTNSSTQIDPQQVHYHLANLFNGNKLLGEEMNRLLNKEWKDAWKELSPPLVEAMNIVIRNILAEFSKRVPFDDIFPEKL